MNTSNAQPPEVSESLNDMFNLSCDEVNALAEEAGSVPAVAMTVVVMDDGQVSVTLALADLQTLALSSDSAREKIRDILNVLRITR